LNLHGGDDDYQSAAKSAAEVVVIDDNAAGTLQSSNGNGIASKAHVIPKFGTEGGGKEFPRDVVTGYLLVCYRIRF
jgi:hypothetical protein